VPLVAKRKPRARSAEASPRLAGVVYERDGRWWTASLPAFPGAYSQGLTRRAAYLNLLSAIRDLVDAYRRQARKPAPRPRAG